MSEGWNIAVLGATGRCGRSPGLKRWLNVSSRLGKFMHWHVTKAQAEQLRFGGKTITVQDAR
ncbi:putative semialdehyde dehydrogenase [Escherichia coli]|uniref:Putative semialdehyde dehydrogenase n=1 Tax=Escherichia coli TaxID=562 RepID=A0A2X1K3U1_ECOLX|nr:putative semialdehyde dehydrogenase [Escherichia coli]